MVVDVRLPCLLLFVFGAAGCDRPASASVQRGPDAELPKVDAPGAEGRSDAPGEQPSRSVTGKSARLREGSAAASGLEASCPKFSGGAALGKVASDDIDETSGVVTSRRHPAALWVHNDSGDDARLFAVQPSGQLLGIFSLPTVQAVDWEDIAIGPGKVAGRSYLYIADIGDNGRRRDDGVFVYRVPEPPLPTGVGEPQRAHLGPLERFRLRYPDGPHDAETLLIDPRSGELVLLTKALLNPPRVFHAKSLDKPLITLEGGQPLDLEAAGIGALLPTGGDVSPDGRWVLVRSYRAAYLWQRGEGQALHEVFASPACVVPLARELQGEAIGFSPDGQSYYTIAEGRHPTIFRYSRER